MLVYTCVDPTSLGYRPTLASIDFTGTLGLHPQVIPDSKSRSLNNKSYSLSRDPTTVGLNCHFFSQKMKIVSNLRNNCENGLHQFDIYESIPQSVYAET